MGIDVRLETETGELLAEVGDPKNLLHHILPTGDDVSFRCLGFVDWYGDTIFNRQQMEDVRKELTRLAAKGLSSEQKSLLNAIDRLAEQGASQPHRYLKFIGD